MGLSVRRNVRLPKISAELLTEAAKAGMGPVKDDAVKRVPKETGHLASTAEVSAAGDGRASLRFAGPYAAYIHERTDIHRNNGEIKYAENAMHAKAREAGAAAAEHIRANL